MATAEKVEDGGAKKLLGALDIMQRMPPSRIEESLTGLLNLIPEETDELLQRIDQPLTEHTCPKSGKKYLLCDYNRDGDSFRSPWSNVYDPPIEEGLKPTGKLRKLEQEANKVFALYAGQYYGAGTITSVYFWDLEGKGFASCWLVKKAADSDKLKGAVWDAIHVMQVIPNDGSQHNYQLTSTIMVSLGVENAEVGDLNLSGSLIRQSSKASDSASISGHIKCMGKLIEDQEARMKSELEKIYFNKMLFILDSLRKDTHNNFKLAGLAQKAARQKHASH